MKANLIKLLSVSLLWITNAVAAPSLLGMCHKDFNCNGVKSLYTGQETIIIGWLENTFSQQCKCADELLKDPRPKIARVHIANGPCLRNKRCGRYEIFAGETIASANRAFNRQRGLAVTRFKRVVNATAKRLNGVSNLTCYVSPCLECDLNERARRFMASVVSAAMPTCNLVDNPYRRSCLPGTICEKHGVSPSLVRPCIVDLDGIDGGTVNLKQWADKYRHCDLRYYWEPWMNCIRGSFIEPRSRNCKYQSSWFEGTKGVLCQYFYPSSDICLP